MPAAKTTPGDTPVGEHLAALDDAERRADCEALVHLMTRVTGCEPQMWGRSIVGFDRYHYRYASGHEGDAAVVGFASGRRHLTLYLAAGFAEADGSRELLARLGRHTSTRRSSSRWWRGRSRRSRGGIPRRERRTGRYGHGASEGERGTARRVAPDPGAALQSAPGTA
jgi:hypothetical protein